MTTMTAVRDALPALVSVIVLMSITAAVLGWTHVPHPLAPAAAVLRGAIQLAVISLVLSGIITNLAWVGVTLTVMFTIASVTATRRIGWSRPHARLVMGAMSTGVLVTLTVIFATGAVDFSGRYLLALGGIIIGNAMSITTLAGRRFLELVDDGWHEVEGWIALGATPRQSTLSLTRRAVYSALIPSTDQTKTTGLVTLPGAFIGVIVGGGSAVEAGQFQILVLAAVMACGAITAVIVVAGLAPAASRPAVLR
jgi:putative ABC transport system permease protein